MSVPREVIEQIRERIELSDLIGEYVRLKRDGSGARFKGLCPFHNERTPSFSVSNDKGFYYCFGCHASGDAFKFLTEHTGMSFHEAVATLADRAGVELPQYEQRDPEEEQRLKRGQEAYYRIMSTANAFFQERLRSHEGQTALQYFYDRGLNDDIIARFQLGFAPDGWTNLVPSLCQQGIPPAHLVRAGLARVRDGHTAQDQANLYDAFRNRVMFPILALNGKPLGFSGRALSPDDPAKYINSPETRFYTKGENLYGIHAGRHGIRMRDQAVLVEGNFDVVALHAAGIDEAVAPLGTAFTARQAQRIGRFCQRVIIAFDGDAAGRKASYRALEVLLEEGIDDVRWLLFDEKQDPDSFVQNLGGEALRGKIDKAPMMLQIVLDEAIADAVRNPDPTIRKQAMFRAANWLRRIPDAYVAEKFREEIARRLVMQVEDIQKAEQQQRRQEPRDKENEDPTPHIVTRIALTPHEQALIQAIDASPDRLERIANQQLYRVMRTPRFGQSLQILAQRWLEGARSWRVFIEELQDKAVAASMMAVLAGDAIDASTGDDEFETLISEFTQLWIQNRSSAIEMELADADRNGEDDRVSALLQELERLHAYQNVHGD